MLTGIKIRANPLLPPGGWIIFSCKGEMLAIGNGYKALLRPFPYKGYDEIVVAPDLMEVLKQETEK